MKIKSEKIENGYRTIVFENGFVIKEGISKDLEEPLKLPTEEEKLLINLEYLICISEIQGGL